MTAATAKRGTAVEPEPASRINVPRVSMVAGFAIDPSLHRFDEPDRVPAYTLSTLLRTVCGSAAEGGYQLSPVTDERCWRTLREAPEAEVRAAVRRAEKLCEWELPGDRSQPLVERIDRFYGIARAQQIRDGA